MPRQTIPFPPDAVPGDPAPWSVLSAEDRHVDLDRVRRALGAAPPPGLIAWSEAVAVDEAAVLVPLFEEAGEAWVVMIRRAAHLRRNAGDVAFPGGRRDPGETLHENALREAQEEIGLDPADVTIVGELDHFITITGGTEMVPFVGVLAGRPLDLVANPGEVEAILSVPLRELLVDGAHRSELWGEERVMHLFELVGDTVWGATARLLHRFLELVTAVPASGS
ncbi:MAG: putative hydrolase [Actinomycetia bacterium]|nr:putative hydrolase [Actinomycetes bacterium]